MLFGLVHVIPRNENDSTYIYILHLRLQFSAEKRSIYAISVYYFLASGQETILSNALCLVYKFEKGIGGRSGLVYKMRVT
jgi:hypothetical protein